MNEEIDQVKQWLLALKQGDHRAIQPLLDAYTNSRTPEFIRERIRDATWFNEGIRGVFGEALIPKLEPKKFAFRDFVRWILRRRNQRRSMEQVYTWELYERELLYYSIVDGYWGPYDILEIINKLDRQAQAAGIEIKPIKARIATISSSAFRYWLLRDEPYIQYRNKWERTPPEA